MNEHEINKSQNDIDHNCNFRGICNFVKEHLISSIALIVNLIGLSLFLIYFYSINYLPDLDFAGTVNLLVVMTVTGIFFSILLYLLFILPSLVWGELLHDGEEKDTKFYKYNFIISYLIISTLVAFIFIIPQHANIWNLPNIWNLLIFSFFIFLYSLFSKKIIYFIFSNRTKKPNRARRLLKIIDHKVKKLPNYKLILYMLLKHTSLAVTITFPLFVIFMIIKGSNNINFIYLILILSILINALIINKKTIKEAVLSLLLFIMILFFTNPTLVPSSVVRNFHIGNFNASIIFNEKYCVTLKSLNISSAINFNKTCYVPYAKVHWRVGKETFLEIEDRNMTVPSSQIISMSWPMKEDSVPVDNNVTQTGTISFEFNSTRITKQGQNELLKNAKAIEHNSTKEITVYGCSSPEETERFHTTLAQKRAQVVEQWITGYMAKSGREIKITAIGESTSKHCSDPSLEKEMQDHRKVEIFTK